MTSLNQDMALKLLKNFINLEFLSKLKIYEILPRFCEKAFSLGGVVCSHYKMNRLLQELFSKNNIKTFLKLSISLSMIKFIEILGLNEKRIQTFVCPKT